MASGEAEKPWPNVVNVQKVLTKAMNEQLFFAKCKGLSRILLDATLRKIVLKGKEISLKIRNDLPDARCCVDPLRK